MRFWNLTPATEDTDAELRIDGEIVMEDGWWNPDGTVCARNFRKALNDVGDVTVYINSPGGDVFAAAEIYSALKEHAGHVKIKISGIAASAASVIAMAGDEVLMSPVAYMMIHDPWTFVAGNAREMEREASVLREIGEGIIAAYAAKTGKTHDEIADMMANETYMSAQTCIDEGFADGFFGVDAGGSARASMRARSYNGQRYCAMLRDHTRTGNRDAGSGSAAANFQFAARAGRGLLCSTRLLSQKDSEEPDDSVLEDIQLQAIRDYAQMMAEEYKEYGR